jgi:hypothetical protein
MGTCGWSSYRLSYDAPEVDEQPVVGAIYTRYEETWLMTDIGEERMLDRVGTGERFECLGTWSFAGEEAPSAFYTERMPADEAFVVCRGRREFIRLRRYCA